VKLRAGMFVCKPLGFSHCAIVVAMAMECLAGNGIPNEKKRGALLKWHNSHRVNPRVEILLARGTRDKAAIGDQSESWASY